MRGTPRVAVVKGDNRHENIKRALELVREDLGPKLRGRVVIKPNLLSEHRQLPSTHVDAVRAVLEFVSEYGVQEIIIAEGATDATAAYRRFGYEALTKEFGVTLCDLNRQENQWVEMPLRGANGQPLTARVSRLMHEADCRISLAIPKVHTTATVTLSIKNMLSCIAKEDREMMHGYGSSTPLDGLGGFIVRALKTDYVWSRLLVRSLGAIRTYRTRGLLRANGGAVALMGPREQGFFRTVVAMNHNLPTMAQYVAPHISVIDGFHGMEGEGPRHGTRVKLGVALASAWCLSADAVGAKIMGFEPLHIGYLAAMQEAALGVADVERIVVLGAPISAVARPFKPHSNYAIQQQWFSAQIRELVAK